MGAQVQVDLDVSGLRRADVMLTKREIPRILRELAQTAEADIKQSMRGGGSGKSYRIGGRTHVASRPGEPPAVLTGALLNSIRAAQVDPLSWAVNAGTVYARRLEFGGRDSRGVYIAPRPYMRRAMLKISARVQRGGLKVNL